VSIVFDSEVTKQFENFESSHSPAAIMQFAV